MSPPEELLEAERVHLWRGDRHVLRGVTLRAAPGDAVHVRGPNGAGKTSLLRTLAGFLWPEEGEIRYAGQPVAADRDAYAAAFAYLGHDNALKGDLTALENLRFLLGLRRARAPADAAALLGRLGLAGHLDRPVRTLSAGQRRRVALARVVLDGAPVWLLDEPFTNLDAVAVGSCAELVNAHVRAGGIVLYTAHGDESLGIPGRPLELG